MPITPITLVVHGGSGTICEEDRANYHAGLVEARAAGFAVLAAGGSALAAVLKAVTLMEDNPLAFNAGTGGSPTSAGIVECDAALMLSDGSCGAVASVTKAKNPILLADKVRTEMPHIFFVGAGADTLVDHPIDNAELLTKRTRAALERWRERNAGPVGSATVGAVALDEAGNLAAATSTGGVLGKWPGRVGDSPLIGVGTYASPSIAVSCTGKGEAFMQAVTAKTVALRLEYGETLEEAVARALQDVNHFDGSGGLICATLDGRVCVGFNAPHMAYAWKTRDGEEAAVGLEPGILLG